MINDLRKSSTKLEMIERIHNLPRGLEEAYRLVFLRLVERLDNFELHLAQMVLNLVIISCRPLTFEEIRYILALDSRSTAISGSSLEDHLLLQPIDKLLEVCGGLVVVTDGHLRLVHSSVKDFLVRPENHWGNVLDHPLIDFRVDSMEANRFSTSLSLDYINMEKNRVAPDSSDSSKALRNCYPFIDYAFIYTAFHLNRSGPLSNALQEKLKSVFESAESIEWVENFAILLMEDPSLEAQMSELTAVQDTLSAAGASIDLIAAFEILLKRELAARTRNFGSEDPFVEKWQMFLGLAEEGEFHGLRKKAGVSDPIVESEESIQPRIPSRSLRDNTRDPSTDISRLIQLLDNHSALVGGRQIEILLRFQTSL